MTKALPKTTDIKELLEQAKQAFRQGDAGQTIALYNQVLEEDPNNTEALTGLSGALLQTGRINEGLQGLARAIIADPEDKTSKVSFVHWSPSATFEAPDETMRKAILLCFEDLELRHRKLFFIWEKYMAVDPFLGSFYGLISHKTYKQFEKALPGDLTSLPLNEAYLCEGLAKLLLSSTDFEGLMRHMRRAFLLRASPEQRVHFSQFLMALAKNCFLNEYVFSVSKAEEKALKELSGNDVTDILLRACYEPLHDREDVEAIAEILRQDGPEGSDEFICMLIEEPLEEQEIRKGIPSFSHIQDDVSQVVRQQYEENPYPRWATFGGAGVSEKKQELSKGLDMLAAGCGTGQQTAGMAMNYPMAKILGVDLSKNSLAYAIRKSRQMGLDNIEYMHGDLLDIASLDRKFDFIACGGVLHHMNSPKDGIIALRDVLKPGGIMKIALYSEIARRQIVAIQNWAEEKGYESTRQGIRTFRMELLKDAEEEGILEELQPLAGFYTTSECRDTYLHAQEHRFTCLGLKKLLAELELDLLQFAIGLPQARQHYAANFPGDPYLTNLENWQRYEEANPKTFLSMYVMTVAPKGSHTPDNLPEWLTLPGAVA